MLIVTGTARMPADDIDRFRDAARNMVDASRSEAGCIEYGYAFDLFDETLLRITEYWVDREALEKHFATPHMQAWRSFLGSVDLEDFRIFTLEGEPGKLPV